MKLHCLGTAGYHPNEQRHTSCYFIPEKGMLLDAGTGLFRIGPKVVHEELDIFLSHAHLDHIIGLTYFLELLATTPLKRVRVYGERAKLAAIRDHLFAPLIFPVLPPIEWIPLEDFSSGFVVGSAEVHWFPLEHPGGSVGFRMNWADFSLAYVTDTHALPESEYWDVVRGVDLLIHECNFRDDQKVFAVATGHSFPSNAILGARKANVRSLLLTHFDPLQGEALMSQIDSLAREGNSSISIYCANDNDEIDLVRRQR